MSNQPWDVSPQPGSAPGYPPAGQPTSYPGQPGGYAGQPGGYAPASYQQTVAAPGYAPGAQTAGYQPAAYAQPGQQQFGWTAAAQQKPSAQGRGARIAAAIIGLVGALIVVAGSVLPFETYSGQPATSIFGGYPGAPSSEAIWYGLEPAIVALAVAVLSVVLLVRAAKSPAVSGMLAAFGLQTMLLFAGYALAVYSPATRGAGGFVGVLGGMVVLAAGLVSLLAPGGQQAAAAAPGQSS